MPYGSDPIATLEPQKPPLAPSAGGYGKDPLWHDLKKTAEPQISGTQAAGQGLWEGLKEFYKGAEGIGVKLLTGIAGRGQELVPQQEAERKQQEAAFRASPAMAQHPYLAGGGRILGQAAPAMAMPGGPGLGTGARALLGALGGAVASGIPSGGNLAQTGIGAGVGAATGGAGAILGPPLSQGARAAIAQFPHIASLVRGDALVSRSVDNANRAAINQALDPIKTIIPATIKAGHDLINEGRSALREAYNKVLPGLRAGIDPELQTALTQAKTYTGTMTPEEHKQLVTFIEHHFEVKVTGRGGTLDGQAIKDIESDFGKQAQRSAKDHPQLADALYQARDDIMESVARQNTPQAATDLRNINLAYAMWSRIKEASIRDVDAKGTFTPHNLLLSARGNNKGSFATGDALMQAVGEAMLGPTSAVKVSRILTSILGGAIGGARGSPMGSAIGAGIGAAVPDILQAGVRATQTPIARGAGRLVSRAAPVAGETARETYVSTVGP